MRPEPRARRRAAVLVILAAALWWHAWMPAVLLVAFGLWAVLHTRFQGDRRAGFMRLRARVWPPATLVLVTLIVAGTAVYGLSRESVEAKVLPMALNAVALAMLVVPLKRPIAVRATSEARSLDGFRTERRDSVTRDNMVPIRRGIAALGRCETCGTLFDGPGSDFAVATGARMSS